MNRKLWLCSAGVTGSMETAHRREHRYPSVFQEKRDGGARCDRENDEVNEKIQSNPIECQTDMLYTCPRITYRDQLPTRKVTANYSEKKPGMGRKL